MLQQFKEFALRGNVVDMAVGIIMGAAFSTIVKSLVDDIYYADHLHYAAHMRPYGRFRLLGPLHQSERRRLRVPGGGREAGAATINVGVFINIGFASSPSSCPWRSRA